MLAGGSVMKASGHARLQLPSYARAMRTGAAGLLIAALAAAACGSDDVKGTASVEPQFLIEGVPPERQQNTVCGVPAEGASGYRCQSGAYTGGDHAPCIRLTLARQAEGPSPTSALFIRYSTDDSLCVSAGAWVIGDPNAAVRRCRRRHPICHRWENQWTSDRRWAW